MRIARLGAASLLIGVTLTACGNNDSAPPEVGVDAPAFEDANALLVHLRESGVICSDERPFDPIENVAPDAVDYSLPEAILCAGTPDLYVLVYDSADDRIAALDHGDVNLNLCSFTQDASPDPAGWTSVVGANWRVATPAPAPSMNEVLASFGEDAAMQSLSCEFSA